MTVHVTTVCRSPVWTRTRVYSNLTYQICKQQSFMDSEGEKRLISTFQAQQTCRYTLVILTGILNTSFVSTYTLACKVCFSGYSFTFTGNGATRHYSFPNAAFTFSLDCSTLPANRRQFRCQRSRRFQPGQPFQQKQAEQQQPMGLQQAANKQKMIIYTVFSHQTSIHAQKHQSRLAVGHDGTYF